jgi:beta-N-acetylhexosaminidase
MIKLGITHLLTEKQDWLDGKSVGLLTNHTGVDENLTHTIELLREFNLVALFSPEHGLWGAAQDGVKIVDSKYRQNEEQTLQVYSLYDTTPFAWTEALQTLDVLIYDIQDVGARYYTYLGTLLETMKALEWSMESEKCVACIVADRPNPIGGISIEGPMLESDHTSLVGPYPIPVRYGMTIGEVARLFHAEQGFNFPLEVARMQGWHRGMWYNETGLPWVPPSPNMPTLNTATLYPGTCLFEGTNVSEGRGTTKPFEYIGAPWINKERLATRLNKYQFPGVLFRPIVFTPQFSKYEGEVCHGVAIHITDQEQVTPVEIAVWMLGTLLAEHSSEFEFRETHFDRLAGSSVLREALLAETPCDEIIESWAIDIEKFRVRREPYLLY